MFALYATLAQTPGRRWAMAGLILTVCGACFVLVGGGFAIIVVPAAGLLISLGHEQDVVRLLDQVYREPGLIPVFLGGLAYNIGLVITSVAVWRSKTLRRWAGGLLAAAGVLSARLPRRDRVPKGRPRPLCRRLPGAGRWTLASGGNQNVSDAIAARP